MDCHPEGLCIAITDAGRHCQKEATSLSTYRVPLCSFHLDELERILGARYYEEDRRWAWDQRRRREPARTVYYVRRADGLIKIGVTGNLKARIRHLRADHGPLELLATHDGGRKAEAAAHRRFAEHRVEGEWFAPGESLLEHLAELDRRAAVA